MNIIAIILLVLLLNIFLGSLATYIKSAYIDSREITLYDLIMVSLVGIFVFMMEIPIMLYLFERKTSNIILLSRKNNEN